MATSEALPGGPAAEAGASARSRIGRTMVTVAGFAAIFVIALVASWQIRLFVVGDGDPGETRSEAKKKPALKKIEAAGTILEAFNHGDEALIQYRFAEALRQYEDALQREPQHSALVDYRVGLCHEALGALDKAQDAYHKAITNAATPSMTLAAHLGMARCLLRSDHPGAARRLLYPFVHDEARQVSTPAPLLAAARSIIALAFAREANPAVAPSPLYDGPIGFLSASLEVPFYLDEIGPAASRDADPVVETLAPPLRLTKQKEPLATSVERVELEEPSAAKLLDRLAREAGLRTTWSELARQSLADRPLRLSVRNWPLVDLLEQAADRFEAIVAVNGETVSFFTPGEQDAIKSRAVTMETARRALLAALAADEAQPWTPAVYLELGNIEAAQGRSKKAAIWFERLLRKTPSSSLAAPACYNLALAHWREQDFTLARQTYFRVIDQAPGHELALRAYVRVGQGHLEEDNTQEAIRQLRRALPLAPNSAWHGVHALVLAAAHLQSGDAPGARQVLNQHRKTLQKQPCKSMAAFLDCYAQYRLAKPLDGGRREAGELLNVLGGDWDDRILGPTGVCLAAQAFLDLGLTDHAERLLRKSLVSARGPVVVRLESFLAESLLALNRQDDATPLLEKLSTSTSAVRPRARYRLAQIDLQKKQYTACAEKCRDLWRQGAFPEPAALLNVWGAALEGTGDYANAARCFAGKAPE